MLVGRAQLGDADSLDRILRSLQEPLYHHVRLIVGDDHVAEEALQDSLHLVARKLGGLRDPRWLRAWAYRIATRQAVRRVGVERRWREALRDDELSTLESPREEPRVEPEWIEAVPRLIEKLSPASALVVRMHYLDGLSLVEIAEALELSVGTVKSRLAYGLAALRRDVEATPR